MTFMCTGKQKNVCDLPYHDIRFIAVVWNPTHNVSEVCLYPHGSLSHLLQVFYKSRFLTKAFLDHLVQITTYPFPLAFITYLTCSSFMALIEF